MEVETKLFVSLFTLGLHLITLDWFRTYLFDASLHVAKQVSDILSTSFDKHGIRKISKLVR